MQKAWIKWGGPATVALLALLMGESLKAQDGVRPVAEELGQRAAAAATEGQQRGGLSDSGVRVLMTYAFSIIGETQPGPDGKPIKVDKTNPQAFLIPPEDARRVIRAATRSAYAEACGLPELAQANHRALMHSEQAKKTWSSQQLMMINALHIFSASYFAGNATISEPAAEGAATQEGQAAGGTALAAPQAPACPPEQKQKVESAIKAYVQSAQAP